jgi:DNA-binding transcriptional MocR family regulator
MGRSYNKRRVSKFVKLDHWILETDAYKNLGCGARSLLIELIYRFNGRNNGMIFLSSREAAERLNISKNTVGGYYKELCLAGFIVETRKYQLGVSGKGKASNWRLTHLPCDLTGNRPTLEFKKQNPVPTAAPPCPKNRDMNSPVENSNPAKLSQQTVQRLA